jgi:hypothetical protein
MRILFHTISVAAAATAFLASPALSQVTAARPWSVEGRIEDSDRQADERRYDEHRLRLEAGRRYRLVAESDDFDPMLQLYSGTGGSEPIAENDDAGGSLNSRIIHVPETAGNYTLRIRAFAADGRGAYSLRAEQLPPLPPATAIDMAPRTMTWTTVNGTLAEGDPEPTGGPSDDYSLFLGAGEEAIIRVDGGFDTLVSVFRGNDRDGDPVASDDDGGGGLNSMLLFRAEEAGEYVIRVSAVGDGTGAYRLRIGQ